MNQKKVARVRKALVQLFDELYPHIRPLTRNPLINDLVIIFEQCSSPIDPDDPATIPEVHFY